MANEELLQHAMILKQQSEEVEKQLQFVGDQIIELNEFSENLKNYGKDGEKEVLAPLGRGVFVKADRNVDEKLFVEVGAGVLVRKTPEEARKIIEGQVMKFQEAKTALSHQLEEFAVEFRSMIGEIEKIKEGSSKI